MNDHTTITGNLTCDPELRQTPGGLAYCTFRVAVQRRWLNRDRDQWEERTSFFNVVCWRELAEHVTNSVSEHDRVIVTGRLEQRCWETEHGDQRSVVEIVAVDIGISLRHSSVWWLEPDGRAQERSA